MHQKIILAKSMYIKTVFASKICFEKNVNYLLKTRLTFGEFYHLCTDFRKNEILFHV